MAALNARAAERAAIARFEHQVALLREAARAGQAALVEGTSLTLGILARALLPGRPSAPGCEAILNDIATLEPGRYTSLAVVDAEGRAVCAWPSILAGEDFSGRDWFARVRQTGAFTTSEFMIGRTTGLPVVVGAYPLISATGTFEGAVIAGVPLDLFAWRATPMREKPLVWLMDRSGGILPLTEGAAPRLPVAALERPVGAVRAVSALGADGTPLFVASAEIGAGLSLVVAEPSAEALSIARSETLWRLGELGALLALCLVTVAFGASVTVIRPLQRLRAAAARWREGEEEFDPGDLSGTPEEVRVLAESFRRSSHALATREQELRAALDGRELLMAEIHHRVKNNLQIISSLLNLQAARIREPTARAEFESARDRVRALATLHRHLYMHPDHETVDLAAFIRELAGQLFQAMGERPDERIRLVVDAPSLVISSDQAVPLALLITEAVSNALTYAFPGGRRGNLEVRVIPEHGRARLTIRDDGVGGADRAMDRRGLGGQLLRSLARQLGGALVVEPGPAGGSMVALDFPLRPPIARPPPALRPPAAQAAKRSAPPVPSSPA